MFFLVQEYLKEEPYTAEEIENITGENLTSFLNINASYLEVIKAAKQYKLHQVCCCIPITQDFMCDVPQLGNI